MVSSQNLPRTELRALGARLRERGLAARALEHVLGLRYPSLKRLALTDWTDVNGPPAAIPALLFCGRGRLSRDAVTRCFGDDTDALRALGLLEWDGASALAPVAVIPVGDGLAASPWNRLPDDSSLHLCGALPARAGAWLDIGTGAAFAPIHSPNLAPAIAGTDLDEDALELAELGLALSGIEHVSLHAGDLFDTDPAVAPASLVTFNAPLCDGLVELMARFWDLAARMCAPGGEVLVHCRADVAIPDRMPGSATIVEYTPDSAKAFAVVSWCPDRPTRRRRVSAQLDYGDPHVRRDWISRDDSR